MYKIVIIIFTDIGTLLKYSFTECPRLELIKVLIKLTTKKNNTKIQKSIFLIFRKTYHPLFLV